MVQIHLQQDRTDLALKEVQDARRWAQDSLLVNIAESWVGLRVVWRFIYLEIQSLLKHDRLCAGRREVPASILRL